jgi:hypothetical protein
MQIAGVLTAGKLLSSALGQLARPFQPQKSALANSAETSKAAAGPAGAKPRLREIVGQYDVTNISPREFSEMIRRLHEAGALTDEELQDVSMIRVDLDLERIDPDESLSLVEFYVDKLRELRRSLDDGADADASLPAGERSQLAAVQRRLQWVEKLAAIQAGADRAGLDALA